MSDPDAGSPGCEPETELETEPEMGKDFHELPRTAGQAGKSLFKAVLQFEQHKVKLQMNTDETGPHSPH